MGATQSLSLGSLANFNIAKRYEILAKSTIPETPKDSLLRSPLTDKIFGLSLEEVHKEVSKTPRPASVNVQVNNGKRDVSFHASQPDISHKKKNVFRRNRQSTASALSSRSASKFPSNGGSARGNTLSDRNLLYLSSHPGDQKISLPRIPVGGRLTYFVNQ